MANLSACPAVSIIVPNYNHEKFLDERLKTVLNQTHQDFEVIILDDCSTDNSVKKIEEIIAGYKGITTIFNTENSGSTFKQWQKAFALARGEYIWIAESDDVAGLNFLEEMLKPFKTNDNCVLAYTSSTVIDEHGVRTGTCNWGYAEKYHNWNADYRCSGATEIINCFSKRNIIPNASAVLFKKSCLQDVDFSKIVTMRYAGDWYFWVEIAKQGDVHFVNQFLNHFRKHCNTTRSAKNARDPRRFTEVLSVLTLIKRYYNVNCMISHGWILTDWFRSMGLIAGLMPKNTRIFPLKYRLFLPFYALKFAVRGK